MAGNKTSTAKASTNGATNKSRRSASVSSARVLAMYQAALDEGQSDGDFMMRLKKVGGYSSEKKAAARLHRFKSYLRKKYDVELAALKGTPRLTEDRGTLLASYSALVKR